MSQRYYKNNKFSYKKIKVYKSIFLSVRMFGTINSCILYISLFQTFVYIEGK